MRNFWKRNIAACIMIILALGMMATGLIKGDFMLTKQKGSMICTQCVGFK